MLPISMVDDVDFGFRNFRARLMMERRREVVVAVEIFLDRLGRCRVSSCCCCSKVLLLSLSFVMLLVVSTSLLADDGTSCTVAVDKLACEWTFSVVLMVDSIAMGEWMIYRT